MTLRYSIIHHDIREFFGLSLIEYAVCDSIHQLSHQFPTTKTNEEIAEFLGIDQSTVSRIKRKLIKFGLVLQIDKGYKTTELWWSKVTEKDRSNPKMQNNLQSAKNNLQAANYSTNKEYITTEANASEDISSDLEEDLVPISLGRRKGVKKTTSAMKEVFEVFFDNPARKIWHQRAIERESATVLHEAYGLDELKKRYGVVKKYRGESMCPSISSPSEFLSKMPQMERFLKNL